MALAGLPLTAFLLIPLWPALEWRKISPLLTGSLFGVPLGVYLLHILNAKVIMIFLGLILIMYGLYGLFVRAAPRPLGKAWGYFFGVIAGCLGGGFSAPGPPVILYAAMQPWTKEQVKATLQGYFFLSGVVVVIFQAMGGYITLITLWYFAIALLPLLLGTYLGHVFFGQISEALYQKVILLLLTLMGLFTLWRA